MSRTRRRAAGLVAAAVLLGSTGASVAGPAPGVFSVVALGDSVPAGDACGCTPYPGLVADALAAGRDEPAVVVDLAVGGAGAADARTAALGAQEDLAGADVVVVQVGANDVAPLVDAARDAPLDEAALDATLDEVAAELDGLLDALPAGPRGRRVVVVGYWAAGLDGAVARAGYTPSQRSAARRTTRRLDARLHARAALHHVEYLDLRPVFHGADGNGDPTALLADDGDHPDAAGHAAIARALEALLG